LFQIKSDFWSIKLFEERLNVFSQSSSAGLNLTQKTGLPVAEDLRPDGPRGREMASDGETNMYVHPQMFRARMSKGENEKYAAAC
jgi:hypothetical protein